MTLDELERKKWFDTLNFQDQLAYDVNPNLFRATHMPGVGIKTQYAPGGMPEFYDKVLIPSLDSVFESPDEYRKASDRFLEEQLVNPSDYNPQLKFPSDIDKIKKAQLLEEIST